MVKFTQSQYLFFTCFSHLHLYTNAKLHLLTCFCVFLYTVKSYAQSDSIAIGRVLYMQEVNIPNPEILATNGLTTLLFNTSCSVFIHNGVSSGDSLIKNAEYLFPIKVSGDKEGFPIYKLHTQRTMFCKIDCRQSSQDCIVRDTFGTISWQLQPERRRFGPYECRRATGEFRGRTYEAWYAVEIPVPSGPYKLGGLPGLILEARSLDDRVKFLFAGIDISDKIQDRINPPRNGKNLNMTYREFIEGELEFCKNFEKEARARGSRTTVTLAERIELTNE